jgi:surface antigen
VNATNLPINHPKNHHQHSRKKATHSSEFVANRRLSYNRAVGNGWSNQHHWQLNTAGVGSTKLFK